MGESRVSRVLAFLVATESICNDSDNITFAVLETQSAIGMELAWWHELIYDLDITELHAHKMVVDLVAPASPPTPLL